MNLWVLVLVINTQPVKILDYKYERDCTNAATAVRLSLKAVDSGTKVKVFCEWKG